MTGIQVNISKEAPESILKLSATLAEQTYN